MIQITERDRQVVRTAAAHQDALKALHDAGADATVEHLEAVKQTKLAHDQASALPMRFVCSDGECNGEHEMVGHTIFTVSAVCWHVPVEYTDDEGNQQTGIYKWEEFDRGQERHLILCSECEGFHGMRARLREADLDGAYEKARETAMEFVRLRQENDRLAELLEQTEQQVAQLRLELSKARKR